VKLSPEFLAKQRESVSLYNVIKGRPSPFVVWLHNQLNVEEPRSYSLKHDGPLCYLNVKNICSEQEGTHSCKVINAAGDKTCSTHLRVKTGWHLHALVFTTFYVSPGHTFYLLMSTLISRKTEKRECDVLKNGKKITTCKCCF